MQTNCTFTTHIYKSSKEKEDHRPVGKFICLTSPIINNGEIKKNHMSTYAEVVSRQIPKNLREISSTMVVLRPEVVVQQPDEKKTNIPITPCVFLKKFHMSNWRTYCPINREKNNLSWRSQPSTVKRDSVEAQVDSPKMQATMKQSDVMNVENQSNNDTASSHNMKYVQNSRCPWRNKTPVRQRQSKFWRNTGARNLNENWRKPLDTMTTVASSPSVSEISCDSDRARKQSESSQASEDSCILFDRTESCDSESLPSDGMSDTDESCNNSTSSSSDEQDLEEININSKSNDHSEEEDDADDESDNELASNDDSDDEVVFKVGDGDLLSLPGHKLKLPPTNNESDDDDDWIVFQSEDDAGPATLPKEKHVRFNENDQICYFYDDADCRAARHGKWEEMARDRSRFQTRILSTATVLSPILNGLHRHKIYVTRFCDKQ